jgi:predicted anti-sigma-YlaC factor YlaD
VSDVAAGGGGTAGRGTDPGLDCDEVVELVTAYLDGALEPDVVSRITEHLAGCEGCTRYVDQMRRTVTLLGRLPDGQLPDERLPDEQLPDDSRRALLAAFRNLAD